MLLLKLLFPCPHFLIISLHGPFTCDVATDNIWSRTGWRRTKGGLRGVEYEFLAEHNSSNAIFVEKGVADEYTRCTVQYCMYSL